MPLTQTQPLVQVKKPKPSIGLFLLYIFISAALIIFVTYPKYTDWRSNSTQLTSNRQQLTKVQTAATQATTEIASMQTADLSKIVAAVPATPNLTDLYAQIESLANAATAHLVSVQGIVDDQAGTTTAGTSDITDTTTTASGGIAPPPGPITPPAVPSSLGTISVSVDVSGSYSAVQQFLSSLYSSLRIITVQQIAMSTQQTASGSAGAVSPNAPATIDLKAQLQTYYSK